MKYVPKEEHPTVNTQPSETFKDLVLLVLGMIGSLLLIVFISIWLVTAFFASLSPKQERKWLSWMGYLYEGREIPVSHFAHDILEKMSVDLDGYRLTLKLSCDSKPNAYALPGGTIVLTKGLFDALQSQQGLAFVIGHEIGHIKNRDHMKSLGRTLVITIFSYLLGLGDSQLFSWGFSFIDTAYSRQQEARADDFALNRMTKVYQSLTGAAEFFKEMNQLQHTKYEKYLAMLSTHPMTDERIKKIETREAKLPTSEIEPLSKLHLNCQ